MEPEDTRTSADTTTTEKRGGKRSRYLATPVNQLDLGEHATVRELVDNFSTMSIQARSLGTAAKLWETMISDSNGVTIFAGFAGPLIAAGLRNVLTQMVRNRMLDIFVTTGAIIYQDLLHARGGTHYIGSPSARNEELRDLRINRIYDTFIDDYLFEEADEYVKTLADGMEPGLYSSREFVAHLASKVTDESSILKACHDTGTPVFVPALNDSSIGIGLTKHWAERPEGQKVSIDSIKDNHEMVQVVMQSEATAGVYVGGGVPKNFINDAIVMAEMDFGSNIEGHKYAIQITTATPHDGGLSGSTLEEGVAWGKVRGDARRSTAYVEASIGLPLLYGYLNDQALPLNRKWRRFSFE